MEEPIINTIHEIKPGDLLILGKRRWAYKGRSSEDERYAHEQNEFLFVADSPSPGALGDHRVFSQSELEALTTAGFLHRIGLMQVKFKLIRGIRQPVPVVKDDEEEDDD